MQRLTTLSFSTFRPAALTVLLSVFLGVAAAPAWACGRTSDCTLGERTYRIVLPSARDTTRPLGAIVFAHGYRGSAAGTMNNDSLVGLADALDMAFVAANADGRDWQLPGAPSFPDADGIAALAYFDALRRDLIERFAVDPERIVAAGFSAGGMMVWHLACHRGDAFAGFVPLSGTFWAPVPEHCPTPSVDLVHYHGTDDTVVPLAGRPINQSRQGDVRDAMALFTAAGGYQPVAREAADGLDCDRRENDAGRRLELCLFAGGHGYRPEHLVRAMRIFELTADG